MSDHNNQQFDFLRKHEGDASYPTSGLLFGVVRLCLSDFAEAHTLEATRGSTRASIHDSAPAYPSYPAANPPVKLNERTWATSQVNTRKDVPEASDPVLIIESGRNLLYGGALYSC